MLVNDLAERRHEHAETLGLHPVDRLEPVAALREERHRALLRRVGLEVAVDAATFARRAKEGEECLSEGGEEQESIASLGGLGARVIHAEAEARVLLVPERLL